MSDSEPAEPGRSLLDRALRVFADVRSGESVTVLLMLSNIFLILFSYQIIKVVREPLILAHGGAEVKSYSAAGQAVVLMVFVPLYGWFSTKVDRMKLIVGVTLFFAINIELWSLAVALEMPHVGVLFYIWVGIFSLMIIAQFWSYANDIYSKGAGDRLFPIIVIGMTAGTPFGAGFAGYLFGAGVSISTIMHSSAVLLLVSLSLYVLVNRRVVGGQRDQEAITGKALAGDNGFTLVFKSHYLRLVALLIVLLNTVNSTGNYIVDRLLVVEAAAATDPEALIGAFYGGFYFLQNTLSLVLQAFIVSRIVKHLGFAGVLLALPLVSLGAYTAIAAGVALTAVRWVKISENATDYSVMNTARQLLWLPTTREEKYKAKQAIDAFFTRLGDVASAGIVVIGTTLLALDYTGFAAFNLILVLAWLGIGVMVVRENRRLVAVQDEREAA